MNDTWNRIERWLDTSAPALRATLRAPSTEAQLADAEKQLGLALPAALRASLLRHDGQAETPGLVEGWRLLSVEEIVGEWHTCEDDSRGLPAVTPRPGVRDVAWSARWVPVASLGSSDVVCVDLDPADGGTVGQVIVRWKSGAREILAVGFGEWLTRLADELEAGRYTVDAEGFLDRK